ncbi:MAG: FKBP-type peptidyl-prolyl cis-trans isomerase [bacterium]
MKKGKMTAVSFLIVLVVIAILVFITINKREINMQNNSGVVTTILKEGTGQAVKAGDSVAMNYTGTLENGTVFDSNVDPKFNHVEPFVFTIGAGQVIKGWDVGVAGMKVGEQRRLVISPDFAYGATGAGGGIIPPNATISFDVELVRIEK